MLIFWILQVLFDIVMVLILFFTVKELEIIQKHIKYKELEIKDEE